MSFIFELDFPRLQYSRFTTALYPFCELWSEILFPGTIASRSGIAVFFSEQEIWPGIYSNPSLNISLLSSYATFDLIFCTVWRQFRGTVSKEPSDTASSAFAASALRKCRYYLPWCSGFVFHSAEQSAEMKAAALSSSWKLGLVLIRPLVGFLWCPWYSVFLRRCLGFLWGDERRCRKLLGIFCF